MKHYIYSILRISDGKIYIGQTINVHNRIGQHRRNKRKDSRIDSSIRKYGWDAHTHMIIDIANSQNNANEKEIKWILDTNSLTPNGFNISKGGNVVGPYFRTENWRKEMSKRVSGEGNPMYGKRGLSNPVFGTKKTDEQRKNLSIAKTGILRSEESKQKQSISVTGCKNPAYKGKVMNMDTKEVYESARVAAKAIGVNDCCMSDHLNGRQKTCGGYTWTRLSNEKMITAGG